MDGVAVANVYGGRGRELHVTVDPQKLAVRGLNLSQMAAALDSENRDVSAGDFDEGKRAYVVRTVGEYISPEQVEEVVLAWRNGAPVYVRDVAEVNLGYTDTGEVMRNQGQPSMAFAVLRQACEALCALMPAEKRPPALMMSLHVWAMAHGIASLFARGDPARRKIPMPAEDLLEASLMLYLRGLGLEGM